MFIIDSPFDNKTFLSWTTYLLNRQMYIFLEFVEKWEILLDELVWKAIKLPHIEDMYGTSDLIYIKHMIQKGLIWWVFDVSEATFSTSNSGSFTDHKILCV